MTYKKFSVRQAVPSQTGWIFGKRKRKVKMEGVTATKKTARQRPKPSKVYYAPTQGAM
jgi:hypothetical protein